MTRREPDQQVPVALPPRERILSVARDLFYRHGLHAVGVEAIAETALTNKMTLYRHFGSKDDLIVAYVSQLAAEGDAIWEVLARAHPQEPDKQLDAWVAYIEEAVLRFDRGCPLANAAVELAPSHPARAVIETYKQGKRERLVSLLRSARYRDPERVAEEIFLLFEGARISIQCGGKGPASRVIALLRSLLASAPRRAGSKSA
jgi:AcrR family transcriptional regulator